MTNIKLPLNFFRSIKTRRLVKRLGEGAERFVLKLWLYVADTHPLDGRLAKHSGEDIEEIVEWDGEKGQFLAAMLEVGWLHPIEDSQCEGYQCHEWAQHQDHLPAALEAEREAERQVRYG